VSTSFEGTTRKAPTRQLRPHVASEILDAVRRRLHASAYPPLSHIECQSHEGVITLRGRVPSFFLKQMAQELAGNTPGAESVTNHIDVVPGMRWDRWPATQAVTAGTFDRAHDPRR